MAFGLTISPFLMMTKHMELFQILWGETSSEAPPKHMHVLKYDIKELNATIKAYMGYDNLALMPTIYAYQEYRVIKVYAQTVSLHPSKLPPTSNISGKGLDYKGNNKQYTYTTYTTHVKSIRINTIT